MARIKDLLVARFLNQGTYNQLAGLCIEYSCAGPSHFAEEAQLRFSAPDSFLMLSMAVFGWGLQYKLSLYKAKNSITHLAPEAKLLSQKERPMALQPASERPTELPSLPKICLALVVALAPGLFRAAARYCRIGSTEKARAPFPPCLESLFFRPPPVLS